MSVVGLDVDGTGWGVFGWADRGEGVRGRSESGPGVRGLSASGPGVRGLSASGPGVRGKSASGPGVRGLSESGLGVDGWSISGAGVQGVCNTGYGVIGSSNSGNGVTGSSNSLNGLVGISNSGIGVYAHGGTGYAAYLDGRVYIRGPLDKPAGSFKIDHPLDPANKYLYHSFVESPDMKNVYDGVVELDEKGEAEIELPEWFGALNKDFRYQLTAIGAPGPNLYIAEEILEVVTYRNNSTSNNVNNNNRFKIAGGTPGIKVSWNVTGIRKDPWANAHRIQVEEDKPAEERGFYIYPDLYGQPEENGISHLLFPEVKQELFINENKVI